MKEGELNLTLHEIKSACKDLMSTKGCIESIGDKEKGGWHKKMVACHGEYEYTVKYFTQISGQDFSTTIEDAWKIHL